MSDPKPIDPWFDSHYFFAADTVAQNLGRFLSLETSDVLDFGCGDGITALGLCRHKPRSLIGVDLLGSFELLPQKAKEEIGLDALPKNLSFVELVENKTLPFPDDHFDAVYSWSVFEHVREVAVELRKLHRVLRPDGYLFLQIEPLYLSPFGCHLRRLIDQPWAHLLIERSEYLQRASEAEDNTPLDERDLLYQTNEFEAVKRYLISEFENLNELTVQTLVADTEAAGFRIVDRQENLLEGYEIPPELLEVYDRNDLVTNEIRLILTK